MSSAREEARRLHLAGYCPVSGRHQAAARIDRADWRNFLARSQPKGEDWLAAMGDHHAAEYYRRVHSKDWVAWLPHGVFRELKHFNRLAGGGHGWGCWTEYQPKQEEVAE